MENSENKPLNNLMVGYSEMKRNLDSLKEIKAKIENGEKDEALKVLDKVIEYIEDDVNYMELFGEEFPCESVREIVNDCLKDKRVPFMNDEGIFTAEYDNFTSQPIEGMLYDLNRDFATNYTLYSNRTVNDLGCAVLITHLMNEIQKLKGKSVEEKNETLR